MTATRYAPFFRSVSPLLWSALAGGAAYIIWKRLHRVDPEQVWAQVQGLTPRAIALAALSCFLSYALVGIYEGFAVQRASGRHLHAYSFLVSWIANPIAHMVGLAAVSGGALRYRMYSAVGLSKLEITATVLLTTLPYILGITASITTALLFEPKVVAQLLHVPRALATAAGVTITFAIIGYVLLNHFRTEPVRIGTLEFPLPGVRLTIMQIIFGAAETMLVASVLFMCMPEELHYWWLQFIGAYMLALLLAQASHVPAGIGVLEASMLVMLPHVPPGKLIGAMLAYRFIFEFVPLIIALLLLLGREAHVRGWWRTQPVIAE